jgi:hypothetical protein
VTRRSYDRLLGVAIALALLFELGTALALWRLRDLL